MKKKVYFSYEFRLGIKIFFSILFGILFIWFLALSFSITKDEVINYSEKSDIDYKVYLKNNDTYDDEYLGKGNIFVSNLIKNILIDFNYNFNVDKNSNIDYLYSIKADLVIYDSKTDKNLFNKEYVLLEDVNGVINDSKELLINKEVSIDYDYYNDLVKGFKSKYGVDGESYLKVYMSITEDSSENNSYYFYNKNDMYVMIPLSEKVIDINIRTNDRDEKSRIINEGEIVNRPVYMVLSLVFFSLSAIFIDMLFKQLGLLMYKRNAYDKLVNKILRRYDKIIVDTTTPPDKSLRLVRVNSFDELKDAHDTILEPIMFYEISKHNKCEFYITHGNQLFLYKVKQSDLEDNK